MEKVKYYKRDVGQTSGAGKLSGSLYGLVEGERENFGPMVVWTGIFEHYSMLPLILRPNGSSGRYRQSTAVKTYETTYSGCWLDKAKSFDRVQPSPFTDCMLRCLAMDNEP